MTFETEKCLDGIIEDLSWISFSLSIIPDIC